MTLRNVSNYHLALEQGLADIADVQPQPESIVLHWETLLLKVFASLCTANELISRSWLQAKTPTSIALLRKAIETINHDLGFAEDEFDEWVPGEYFYLERFHSWTRGPNQPMDSIVQAVLVPGPDNLICIGSALGLGIV